MKNQEPIRVAQIVGKWVGGGVEAVVMNYYKNIDRTKIQFDFLFDDDSIGIPYEEIKNLGGRVILIPPYQKIFKYHYELKKVLKDGNYKIVHSHINALSVFSLFAAKCAGVPVRIAHSHSTTNRREWKKNLLKQLLRPFSKIFATNYMCCSEMAGRWLFGDREYDRGNVYLLNNAIDLDKFKYNAKIRKAIKNELNIPESTLVIGHVGRFVAQKNHSFLIDVFNEFHKQNKDAVLILVGQGPLMEEIQKKVADLNLNKNVRFLGQRNNVNELYNAMDLFLFPSLYEGLGMVTIEAQANCLSCLVSDKVPLAAKISKYITFCSLNKSAKEWAEQAAKMVNESKIRGSKKYESGNYDIKKEAKKLENKYRLYWREKIDI